MIIIHPFSAVREKECPPQLYKDIIDKLPINFKFLITGTKDDLIQRPDFAALLDRENTEFDGSSFFDLVETIKSARLVISVDTAMMHLSVALGTKTLCLASAAYVGEIVPYSRATSPSNAYFCHKPMECQSCLGTCVKALEKGMYPCVAQLSLSMVLEKIRSILKIKLVI